MMDLAAKQLKREKQAYSQQSFEIEASKLRLGTGHLKSPLLRTYVGNQVLILLTSVFVTFRETGEK